MDSELQLSAIRGAKVLVVGAGGIGCELLKTLALSGFQDIHIIDMDTIEVSNLNRQFLFQQFHVGQSKARVASDAVLKVKPHISITPYHANVKDPDFNVAFFKQFNIVLNGLDNIDARRHVNRLCLAAEVPLIDSGTTGFLGQVSVHLKGKTECYECYPKPIPTTYPVCTITSTPSKFVHCIVWAKDLLFTKLFGDKCQENDLNVHGSGDASSSDVADVFEHVEDENIEQYGRRIYDHVFGWNIERALSNEETWKNRTRPKPLYVRDILPDILGHQNGNGQEVSVEELSSISAMSSLGLKNPQDEIGHLSFDKDDQLAVEFVSAAANIRAASFGIPLHSLFDAKGIAGNIVHAVATTNAIVAGLIVIEAIKVLNDDSKNYRMTYCLEHPNRNMLLMPVQPFEPNKSCYVCSKTPILLEINIYKKKLSDFIEKVIKSKLGMNSPLIMHGSSFIYEVGDDLEEDLVMAYEMNLKKSLHELLSPLTGQALIMVEDLYQELSCAINVKHSEKFDGEEEAEEMRISGLTQVLVEKDGKTSVPSYHDDEQSLLPEAAVDSEDIDNVTVIADNGSILPAGKKRRLSTDSEAITVLGGSDVVLLDGDLEVGKKQRLS